MFVVAFNRDRDGYQVPLALAEANLLHELVTDFYASDLSAKLLPALAHRRIAGLPARLTRGSALVLLLQVLGLKLLKQPDRTYAYMDRALGRIARNSARRSSADLLLYSQYAYEAFIDPRLRDRRRILFMFHPHRKLIQQVLRQDSAAFPELAWNFREDQPSRWSEEREDAEVQMAQHLLCASSFTKRSLIAAGVEADRIRVVPYGAHTPTRALATQPIANRPLANEPLVAQPGDRRTGSACRFLFVGQATQRKGLHHLLAAWKRLALPDASLTLVCYRMDPALEPLLGDNVRLLRGVSRRELEALYAGSHVFVMPSLVEGFGLAFLEAMSFGCYVIGSDNTGVPDLKLPASLGSCVPAGDIERLAASMESVYATHRREGLPHGQIIEFARQASWPAFRQGIRDAVASFACSS